MAKALVNSLAAEWDPEKYTDEYRDNLMRIIQAQGQGQEGRRSSRPSTPRQAEVVDLMERLRRSLDQAAASQDRGRRRKRVRPKKRPAESAQRQRQRQTGADSSALG